MQNDDIQTAVGSPASGSPDAELADIDKVEIAIKVVFGRGQGEDDYLPEPVATRY